MRVLFLWEIWGKEGGIPSCPAWLLPEAKKEWNRLAKIMN